MSKSSVSEFIQFTWEMINAGHREISWSSDGTLVVVTNAERLAEHILPQYFKHGQYASWVRALNAYDFKKSGAGRWHHPSFLRGHPELLKNIRRKAPPSRGPGVRASAASSSTALVPRAKKAPISPDLELRWMQQELNRLQGEVGAIRNEDFQQRFDTVRLMQLMLTQLTHRPSTNETSIVLHPAAAAAAAAAAPSSSSTPLQLTYTKRESDDHIQPLAPQQQAPPRDDHIVNTSFFDLPGLRPQPSDESTSDIQSLPTMPSPTRDTSFDISSLELDLGSIVDISNSSTPYNAVFGSGGSGGATTYNTTASSSSPAILEEEEGAMLHIEESGKSASGRPMKIEINDDDGMEEVKTAGAASPEVVAPMLSAPDPLLTPPPPAAAAASLIGALANSAASATALQFASVLARMPPLPASTSQLPPRGTLQRQHIEAAIELAFRQLTITADAALQTQQAGTS